MTADQERLNELEKEQAVLQTRLAHVEKEIYDLQHKDDKYVSTERFSPVERLVYGLVGLVLLLVGTAIITLVIVRQ